MQQHRHRMVVDRCDVPDYLMMSLLALHPAAAAVVVVVVVAAVVVAALVVAVLHAVAKVREKKVNKMKRDDCLKNMNKNSSH